MDFLNFDNIPPSPLYNVDDQVKTYANRHYLEQHCLGGRGGGVKSN